MTSTGAQQAVLARPLRQRRRPALLALGLLMVVIGAMSVWFLLARAGGTVQAVALSNGVQRGAVIGSGDVRIIEVVQGTSQPFVAGDRIEEVVGQVAQFELRPGQVLAPDEYGPELVVPKDRAVVTVFPSQRPAQVLHAGDHLSLVFAGTPQAEIPDPLVAWDATFVRTDTVAGKSGDEFCVVVEVAAQEARAVAAASASGRLVLAQVSEAPK